MDRVVLIHWKAQEAEQRIQDLARAGYETELAMPYGGRGLESLSTRPPSALLVDLSRLPSHGREIASWVRRRKATRHIPIVFVGGEPQKVRSVRELLPDAAFTEWRRVAPAIRKAIKTQPADPIVRGAMAAYSDRPLQKKLGLHPDSSLALVNVPPGFEKRLKSPRKAVRLDRALSGKLPSFDKIILFSRSLLELGRRFTSATKRLSPSGAIWLLWPKKAAGIKTDLDQKVVRAFGLSAGFVDYKICSVDETWSGLLFARRRGRAS